jgi:uncharacterized protein (UPF0332 family)
MTQSIRFLLAKARRNIDVAQRLLSEGDTDIAASRTYYAMYYVAIALLAAEGETYSKHSAVIGAYGKTFARTGRLDARFHRALIDAFEVRSDADYAIDPQFALERLQAAIDTAREFLEAATGYLGPLGTTNEA